VKHIKFGCAGGIEIGGVSLEQKKCSLIMDKEQPKCFHNGIILIVIRFNL
jgi:hypothetical protein